MMNAVLFYKVPSFRLTGSLINAIEYFLQAVEYNPEVKLVLINGTESFKKKLLYLIQEKYNPFNFDFQSNIVLLKKFLLPSVKFDTVLVLDYVTISKTKGILNAKKILVISEKYTQLPKYFYDKSLYNVIYYGEMPFHYKDENYRMKCLFDRYKPLKNVKKGTYVNSPKNDDFIYEVDKIMEKYIHLPTPFIFKSKTEPEENLFEKFTHYLYYHADKWFDPHPRLFLECRFYNKVITYVNPYKIKDGSWYRYYDITENGLFDRYLSKNDEIIRQLI